MRVVEKTDIAEYPLLARGKVRDIYEIDETTLLVVTTDRMSAFDVVMREPVPYKGVVLNQMTLFWMDRFADLVPNHLVERDVARFPARLAPYRDELEGRAVLVRKARPIPLECIVRGYLAGSGWEDYRATGAVCGQRLPCGLREADRLDPPLFTPSTKAEQGRHDENISLEQAENLLGASTLATLRRLALEIFSRASELAEKRGILIADTKFEFGMADGRLLLIDEALTPDSSRFWPAGAYRPGCGQPSFDKQYLRDWLQNQNWDHSPPPPELPQEVIEKTAEKYREAYALLTGKPLAV
jgi:phosphoribosylaminoimidazole-succinocarboxamide synthase